MPGLGAKAEMKALSVKQPWANMIARGQKMIELRSWRTRYRGRLMICSSALPDIVPAGAALAIVNLVECRKATQEDEENAYCVVRVGKDYAWIFENIQRIRPWPIKGGQKLFNIPYEEE